MPYNIRIVSTYPPRRCGIGMFSRDLATALAHFTAEVGNIRVAAIDGHHGPYDISVDLIIDQYNPDSWRNAITHICTRAHQRGYQMRWNNSAWALLQFVDFIREQREIVTGRGPKSVREKPSRLDIYKYKRTQVTPAVEPVTQEPQAEPLAGRRQAGWA